MTKVLVGRQEFLEAVKRVSLMAQHSAPLRLKVVAGERTLTVSAQTQDVGEATEDIEVDVQGEDVEIAFNHAYLTDGITVADGDSIALEIVSPLKPGVMKHPEGDDFIYLLMPVRLG